MLEEMLESSSLEEGTVEENTAEQVQQAAPVPSKEKDSNLNFLRKMADQATRERDDALRRLNEIENKKVESRDEDFSVKDDDLVEGKHLAKYAKKIKQLEDQQEQYMRQSSESNAEVRLKSQFPDFDKVMTLENVQSLSMAYPELAKAINSSSNLYDKASSAYTLIKKFGIYEEHPYEAEKQRAIANSVKPRPLTSVSPQQGDSPMQRANAFANGLTPELKEALLKEMAESRKGY